MRHLTLFWLLLCTLPSGFAALFSDVRQLPNSTYDFIIVGGGTAGLVVANRLTENKRTRVLVLEAGGSNINVTDATVPFLCNNLVFTERDWKYLTVPQTAINNKVAVYTRGRMLGGSSSLNFMFYTRGSSEDFDRYAKLSGDPGWSWGQMQKYMLKSERWTEPADRHDTRGQYNPLFHNRRGNVAVSLPGFSQSIDDRVIETTSQLRGEFPFLQDMNAGRPLGVGWLQSSIDSHGARSSSATAYLSPDILARPNLHVLLNAQVTRAVPATPLRHGRVPTFRGVEFVHEVGGPKFSLKATKEVVLSAGAIGTPVILLHSGIGDRRYLAGLNITSLVHLPDVGRNLHDQANTFNVWRVSSNDTDDNISQNPALPAEMMAEWMTNRTGRFVQTILGNQIIWSRLPKNYPLLRARGDPSPGPNSPHFEIIPVNSWTKDTPPPPPGHYISMVTVVLSPVSRGSVRLSSNNPFDAPLIDPALLTDPLDLAVMREAVRSASRFLSAPVWKDYVLSPIDTLANAKTDAQLDAHIRNSTASIFHPAGSCSMSPKKATYGVVDPDLTVKGISGLRIVDASVLPRQPSGHPQAPIYFFAERASDLIKARWRL